MTRIKEDIIRDVMAKIKIVRNVAKNCVESIIRIIKDTLASGDGVMISGFGNFTIAHKKPRIGRNPKTMVTYEVSERKVVVFSPAKGLRKEMN